MNIEEYRAMVAQEKAEASTPAEPTPVEPTATPEPKSTETVIEPKPTETVTPPSTIKIGEKEYTPEQIAEFEKGYMRNDDYTRKTQALAKERREARQALDIVKQIQEKPELLEKVQGDVVQLNPVIAKMQSLEQELADIKVEREINYLSSKYSDFDQSVVLQYAVDNDSPTLEDAYLAVRNTNPTPQTSTKPVEKEFDIKSLRDEIRNDILRELESNNVTPTIIATNSSANPVQTDEPRLNEVEKKIARMNGMSDAEYAKWRDKK